MNEWVIFEVTKTEENCVKVEKIDFVVFFQAVPQATERSLTKF